MNKVIAFDLDFHEYSEYIKTIGALSRLFSSNDIPYIHYRVVEMLYAKLDGGQDIAGEDNSFDIISKNNNPVGVKTFGVSSLNSRFKKEKIAEFNNEYQFLTFCELDSYERFIESLE